MNLKIIRDSAHFRSQPSALAIGNFDGVHVGHQKVIAKLIDAARGELIPSIMTFEPPPSKVLSKQSNMIRINSFRLKMKLLASLGIQQVLCLRFNRSLATLSANAFIEHYITAKMNARVVMVGQDFEFGFNKQGNAGLLAQRALNYNYDFESVALTCDEGRKVSSSAIRAAIQKDDLTSVHKWLGRHYTLMGRVVRGQGLGRQWGIPTANLNIKASACLARGVFVTRATIQDKHYMSVTNIGVRPTVRGVRLVVETHLLDCNLDLYGQMLQLEILHKLRDEKKFDNVEDLKSQILRDIEEGKSYLFANSGIHLDPGSRLWLGRDNMTNETSNDQRI